jgi:ATP-dependent RNA helicase SUPV3L1/SUV3
MLERLDALLREGQKPGGVVLTDAARDTLGWTPAEAAAVLRALDYTPPCDPRRATRSCGSGAASSGPSPRSRPVRTRRSPPWPG